MGWSVRFFLLEDDDTLRRLSHRVADGLIHGKDSLPQYAGKTIRGIAVVIENEAGKPKEIVQTNGEYWHFDQEGKIDRRDLARSAKEAWELIDADQKVDKSGSVVDISGKLKRQRWENENRWEPSPDLINQIIRFIWPKDSGGKREDVKIATGVRKKKPPMTLAGKDAMGTIRQSLWPVQSKIDQLTESDLKGIVTKIQDDAEYEGSKEGQAIWLGIADAAQARLDMLRARKSSKGRWYAVAELTVWTPGVEGAGTCHVLEEVECNGKRAAILASRELLKKHADQFDEYATVDVQLYPEIEWKWNPFNR